MYLNRRVFVMSTKEDNDKRSIKAQPLYLRSLTEGRAAR